MALIKGKQVEVDTITAREADTANGAVSTVNGGDAAVEGSGLGLSRRDHQHAVATAAAGTVAVGDAAAEGALPSLSRADHKHALPAPAAPANVDKSAASAGALATVARSDHKHDILTATPVGIGAGNAEGALASLARSDHVHDHGAQLLGTGNQHALATPAVSGFMSFDDKVKLDAAQNLSEIDAKESCRVRTQVDDGLTNVTTQRDGVTLTVGDRVLVDGQATATEDGIYIAATGAWQRAADAPVGAQARGWRVWIEEGTTDADRLYACSNNAGSDVVGTHGLTFGLIGAGSPRGAGVGLVLNVNNLEVANADGSIVPGVGDLKIGQLVAGAVGDTSHGTRAGGALHAVAVPLVSAGFMSGIDKDKLDNLGAASVSRQESVTTQAVTAADTALTDVLNNIPIVADSLRLYLNGVYQRPGAGADYTVNVTTGAITWLASTGTAVDMETTDTLDATYLS